MEMRGMRVRRKTTEYLKLGTVETGHDRGAGVSMQGDNSGKRS